MTQPDHPGRPTTTTQPEFFFDVGSPYAYLSAERIEATLGPVAWRPVLLGGIFAANGRRSWATTDARAAGIAEVERRAAAAGLPPLAWPDPWPNDGLRAMRVAAWAAREGAAREYALAAMRVQFAAGEPLSHVGAIADALELAGLRAAEGLEAAGTPAVKALLREATDAAVARGVMGVPTFAVGDQLVWGDDRLDQLGAALDAPG